MRRIIIAAALTVAAGAAQASSIDVFAPTQSARSSIIEIGCLACVKAAEKAAEEKLAPTLAPGSQIVELRHIDGKPMVYRTDNWLGGSAVTWVSKGTPLELQAYGLDPEVSTEIAVEQADGETEWAVPAADIAEVATPETGELEATQSAAAKIIDRSAKTSAITADAAALASAPQIFDASKMELRLN